MTCNNANTKHEGLAFSAMPGGSFCTRRVSGQGKHSMDCRSSPVGNIQSEREPFHAPALLLGSNEEVSQMHPDSPVANMFHTRKYQENTTLSETVNSCLK